MLSQDFVTTKDTCRKRAPTPMLLEEHLLFGQGHLWGALEGAKGRGRRAPTPTLPTSRPCQPSWKFYSQSLANRVRNADSELQGAAEGWWPCHKGSSAQSRVASGTLSPTTQDKEYVWQAQGEREPLLPHSSMPTGPTSSRSVSGCDWQAPSMSL